MNKVKNQYVNREISWLKFNERVLQESADKENVPLIERLRFLGIFSNNLDEFFKVRYATVKRIVEAGKSGKSVLGGQKAKDLLEEITTEVIKLQAESIAILGQVENELRETGVYILKENELSEGQLEFVKDYFLEKVIPVLMTVVLDEKTAFPTLEDTAAYLAVKMQLKEERLDGLDSDVGARYALIEVPKSIDRFVVLPRENGNDYIIILDDLIRCSLGRIFNMFSYQSITAHMIKITRDAELDIDNDLSKSFIEKISSSVEDRKTSDPVRFIYDKEIGADTLSFLKRKMGIEGTDSVIPGGRYHNRRDYMGFPSLGRKDLQYAKITPLPIKDFNLEGRLFDQIAKKDYLQYTPYHTFSYVVRFLREAALDPKVRTIKITVYRLANNSQLAASLINAVKNGKQVTVQIELQARFDEQANIEYAEQLQAEGVKLMFGVPGLKVHSKICIVEREEPQGLKKYGFISTGNFNESTAKIYTDFTIFTAHEGILKDLNKVFEFFDANYMIQKYKHLLVSPHYTKSGFRDLIDKEIANALVGKEAFIKIKMNSLTSYKMVDKLYEASRAGVKVQLIVRGICCLIPGVEGMSENIEAISIVDKFLEHPRHYIFGNNGDPIMYISSADWMTRNLDFRVEVSCPVYDEAIKKELLDTFELSWKDNVKSRVFAQEQENKYRRDANSKWRSQFKAYDYYQELLKS